MAYIIQRTVRPDAIVFALSGDVDRQLTSQLEELLALEAGGRILLDLKDVRLVDRAAVSFLARAEGVRVQMVNCPDYVRRWMAAEPDELE